MNYLESLPVEIKLKILSHLDTCDLIQLSILIPSWKTIVFDRQLIKHINFNRAYISSVDLGNFISQKIQADCVTSLNLNFCNWIPLNVLCKCITRFSMLECLYLVGTKYLLGEDAGDLKKLDKLQRLAISTKTSNISEKLVFQCLPEKITGLYLEMPWPDCWPGLKQLKFLEELWIIDRIRNQKQVYILVIPDHPGLEEPDYSLLPYMPCSNAVRTVTFQAFHDGIEKCYAAVSYPWESIYSNYWYPNELNWRILIHNISFPPPFGVADSKKLITQECTIQDIRFEELNFRHTSVNVCTTKLRTVIKNVVLSSNIKLLKKLSINMCLCIQSLDPIEENKQLLFKRPRIAVRNKLPNPSTFEQFVENSPLIEELEIWKCRSSDINRYVTDASLSCISKLTNLRKLTLEEMPTTVSGQFLIDVFKECKHLSVFRITILPEHNRLSYQLFLALPYATSLTDFRYEQGSMQIDKLFESLSKINNSKLRRVVLIAKRVDKFSELFFTKFLDHTKLLYLLYIYVATLSSSAIAVVKSKLRSRENYKEKLLLIANEHNVESVKVKIPYLWLCELVNCSTRISVLDIFDGFK